MSREAARARQELRRSNAAVPIPSRKTHRQADRLRDELVAEPECQHEHELDCPAVVNFAGAVQRRGYAWCPDCGRKVYDEGEE